jgi:secreted trypsin-like serine protease
VVSCHGDIDMLVAMVMIGICIIEGCGRKAMQQRVIGGVDTYWGEYPWLAAMVVKDTRQPYCIGSVINDRMILTAGHCFKGKFRKPQNTDVVLNGYFMDPMPNIHVVK